MSVLELLLIVAAVAIPLLLAGEAVQRILAVLGAPLWLQCCAWGTVLAVVALCNWVAREAERQAAREHEARLIAIEEEGRRLQVHYPHCHATYLSSGQWFLTDKATGREYQPARK